MSRINSDFYQILRMEYPDMEFPVFFYQYNQIPTLLLFLPDPAERFEIKWGQICWEGVIGLPIIGLGLMYLQKASGGIHLTVPITIFFIWSNFL